MRFKNFDQWLSWLESLNIVRNAYEAKLQVKEVAERLNLLSFPTAVITVAGTNGKGSCVALLESIYTAADYKVGAFTSPHLLHFNERIRIQRQPVETKKIQEAFEKIDQARGDVPLNYFQFSFLASLLIFKEANLDLAILEVGIGGQYDATNIIDSDLTIISSINLDHCEILGDTIDLIAADKAGVMRKSKPAICGISNPPKTFYAKAKEIGAQLYYVDKDFTYETTGMTWSWQSRNKALDNLPLPNSILLVNAPVVLMAIECLLEKFPVTDVNIKDGLRGILIVGRQQLVDINGVKILLDVAHNPEAAKCLAQKLQSLQISGHKYAVFGVLKDKDIAGILKNFTKNIDSWFVAELNSPRSANVEQIEGELKKLSAQQTQCYANSQLAFKEALQQAGSDDIITVFGSFLLVADILKIVNS
jgi:dihydrofolate synthase / folylpolyglutamate synthase